MFLEKVIRIIKRNPNYKWENSYSFQDLTIISSDRLIQILRGLLHKPFLKRSIGLIFIGSDVKIKHANKLRIGRNFILADGSYLNALSMDGINIGNNVSIGRRSTLLCTGVISKVGKGIQIGDGTGINEGVFMGGQGGISIGQNVIIGPGVKIFSENHLFNDLLIPIKDQGVKRQGVVINNNCWIGANVTILDGAIIGSGCVVAAGAVVNSQTPDNCVLGGIPAKVIKYRQ